MWVFIGNFKAVTSDVARIISIDIDRRWEIQSSSIYKFVSIDIKVDGL